MRLSLSRCVISHLERWVAASQVWVMALNEECGDSYASFLAAWRRLCCSLLEQSFC